MKATGIVRRIDELGRVVIPKEIRKTMCLKEGEEMEIFTESGELIFRKYSAIEGIDALVQSLCAAFFSKTDRLFVIDNEKVIGDSKKEWVGKQKNDSFKRVLDKRKAVTVNESDVINIGGEDVKFVGLAVAPIIIAADLYGAVCILSDYPIKEWQEQLALFIANFVKENLYSE